MGGVVVAMVIRAFLFAPLFARSLGGASSSSSITATVVEVFVCVRVFVCVCVRAFVCSCVRVRSCVRAFVRSCVRVFVSFVRSCRSCVRPVPRSYTCISIYLFIYILYFNRAAHPRPYICIYNVFLYIYVYMYIFIFQIGRHIPVCVCVCGCV